jgi:hypothetical protein
VKWRGQVNFIDFVVHPLWKSVLMLFPELYQFESNLVKNRHAYKKLAENPDITLSALTPLPASISKAMDSPLLEGDEEPEEEDAVSPPPKFSMEE